MTRRRAGRRSTLEWTPEVPRIEQHELNAGFFAPELDDLVDAGSRARRAGDVPELLEDGFRRLARDELPAGVVSPVVVVVPGSDDAGRLHQRAKPGARREQIVRLSDVCRICAVGVDVVAQEHEGIRIALDRNRQSRVFSPLRETDPNMMRSGCCAESATAVRTKTTVGTVSRTVRHGTIAERIRHAGEPSPGTALPSCALVTAGVRWVATRSFMWLDIL
ncbi:MAG: hypothetical protein ACOC6J_10615, partial [Spirochaetota bacterium]